MIRWLKIFRAEFIRDLTLALRYPIQLFMGVFILYVLFMGLFKGAQALAGGQALNENLDGMVIGFSMWFFAMIAINVMSMDIETEARSGTLEQVYLHAPSFVGLLWIRGATKISMSAGAVLILSLLIQWTTGRYLPVSWPKLVPLIILVFLTVLGLAGFGLVLGALSLIFKRIGQLAAVVQFSLFFVAYADLGSIADPWRSIIEHLPLARGVYLLKGLLTLPDAMPGLAGGMMWLLVDSLAYALIGSAIFMLMDRIARKSGLLSHY